MQYNITLTEEEFELTQNPKIFGVHVVVSYQGLNENRYTSYTTFEYYDHETGFSTVAGHFE